MAADLSALDLLVVPNRRAASRRRSRAGRRDRVDGEGNQHPLALVEGATENAATVQALLDNLVSRGLDPTVPRLFIVDERESVVEGDPPHLRFGRCDPALARSTRRATHGTPAERASCGHPSGLRQAWELDDADKAEKIDPQSRASTRQQWPGVAAASSKASTKS